MKKLLLIIIAICFLASVAYAAETYTPVTEDDQVTDINQVKIKHRVTTEKHTDKVYTLPGIDAQIAKIQARITHLQGDITDLQALRVLILKEAEKVKLKKDKPPKEMEVK